MWYLGFAGLSAICQFGNFSKSFWSTSSCALKLERFMSCVLPLHSILSSISEDFLVSIGWKHLMVWHGSSPTYYGIEVHSSVSTGNDFRGILCSIHSWCDTSPKQLKIDIFFILNDKKQSAECVVCIGGWVGVRPTDCCVISIMAAFCLFQNPSISSHGGKCPLSRQDKGKGLVYTKSIFTLRDQSPALMPWPRLFLFKQQSLRWWSEAISPGSAWNIPSS